MIDNTKEYIICAAYRKKKNDSAIANTNSNMANWAECMANCSEEYRKSFECITGYRHLNILWDYKDVIDQSDTGGFMTSRGRYVDRHEAAKIAFECGQIDKEIKTLYSEDIY